MTKYLGAAAGRDAAAKLEAIDGAEVVNGKTMTRKAVGKQDGIFVDATTGLTLVAKFVGYGATLLTLDYLERCVLEGEIVEVEAGDKVTVDSHKASKEGLLLKTAEKLTIKEKLSIKAKQPKRKRGDMDGSAASALRS